MSTHEFKTPISATPIDENDQGIYYAINSKTGGINNVFQLIVEDAQWYLYQLKNTDKEGSMGWVILADQGDYALQQVAREEVERYFAKPEYLEPKGAWQVLRNSRYGFGKFTPESSEMKIRYGMILFSDDDMLVPLLIEKATEELMQSLASLDQ